MNDVGFQLRDRLRLERGELIARFQAGGPVEALLKGLARCTDALLRQLATNARLEQQGALVAVGGYGRGELFPHSDVDVLILLERAPDDAERATIERLIGLLWDFGFALGHSVRTVEECRTEAAKDITVLTSLMEARLITGSRRLFNAVPARDRGDDRSRGVFPRQGPRTAAALHQVQRVAI